MVLGNSIRWRFQLWLAFLLICMLSGFSIAVDQLHSMNRFDEIEEELERRVGALNSAIRRSPPPGRGPAPPGRAAFPPPDMDEGQKRQPRDHPDPPSRNGRRDMRPGPGPRNIQITPQVANLFDETQTNGFYYVIWSRGESVLKHSTNAPGNVPFPIREGRSTQTITRTRDPYFEAYQFTELGDCVLAGRSIAADLVAMRRFRLGLVGAGLLVLALGLGGGWWLTSSALRPVDDISNAAMRIAAGNLSERINVAETKNELGRLAGVLNSTFSKLEATFAQQKQFTADASHELRTPLAVIISEAQTTLARPRAAEEYKETVEVCLDTAQRMRRLTDSLLDLARLEAAQHLVQRSPLDLAEVVRSCIERIRPLAKERGVEIHCELTSSELSGDAERLAQVVTNLLGNAIHYNKPQGGICVRVHPENDARVLTVSDTGIGIASGDLPHVFERFYRGDKARARSEGRSGLGLAISKAIVDAHGGRIDITSELGAGTSVTVRLPA